MTLNTDNAADRAYMRDQLLPLKRITYTNGGQLNALGSALTQAGLRFPVRIPVTTTRWRLRLRNYDSKLSAAKGALDGLGVVLGEHALSTLGGETGTFKSNAATSVFASGYTIPGDGSFWVSGWITDPALQFQAGVHYLLGTAWSKASAEAIVRGNGQAWYFTTATDALNPAVAGSVIAGGIPLDLQIEYEAYTDRRVYLVVGDSLPEGVGGDTALVNPWYLSYPQLFAAQHNALVTCIAQGGSFSFDWQLSATADRWTRVTLADQTIDGMVLDVGSNDVSGGINVAAYKSNMAIIAGYMRAIAPGKPLYIANISARGYTPGGASDLLLRSYSDANEALPYGAIGCIKKAEATADPANTSSNQVRYQFDVVHPNRAGGNAYAQAWGAAIRA